ncbi:hypothetical protein FGG08_003151 [Glutinoglossum americanum]|uniref:Uncharacterized protein n=1 Tax=Glutinoglossum americanum TaxID=1670608 RepID=A0A9P8L3X8_9PEZI|nr:hypothetical protein FGG08_003151 [Glutinoglossum americanum]
MNAINPPKCPTCELNLDYEFLVSHYLFTTEKLQQESLSAGQAPDLEKELRALQGALQNERNAHQRSIQLLNKHVRQIGQQRILLEGVSQSMRAYHIAYNQIIVLKKRNEDLNIVLEKKEELLLDTANVLKGKEEMLLVAEEALRNVKHME